MWKLKVQKVSAGKQLFYITTSITDLIYNLPIIALLDANLKIYFLLRALSSAHCKEHFSTQPHQANCHKANVTFNCASSGLLLDPSEYLSTFCYYHSLLITLLFNKPAYNERGMKSGSG